LLGHYGKQHLVPLGETVPLWNLRPVRVFFTEILNLTQGWGRGTEYTLFSLPLASGDSVRFGVPICFEDAFPDLCRRFIVAGGDLWFNITNVSWSRRESAEVQMLVAARFRCIENRRTMVRATNGGVTAVIGAKGEILQSLDVFVEDTLSARVPVYAETDPTPYTLFGDYLPYLLAVLLTGFLAWRRVKGYHDVSL
jgi:apolipoprotein N-acyltransferase